MENNNVYSALALARENFTKLNIQPTGKGQAGKGKFTYFSLDDILPHINKIFAVHGLVQFTQSTYEKMVMTVAHGPSNTTMNFEIPYAQWLGQANLDPIQQLGGALSYMTRYLWYSVMNIAEFDLVDGEVQSVKSTTQTSQTTSSNGGGRRSTGNFQNSHREQPQTNDKEFEKIWYQGDGTVPPKQFEHFMAGDIEYKTMKNKTSGELFGLAVDETITDPKVKFYKFQ